ncbi:MAG: cation transporter [Chloroherpetonaceae bacterium]|nr:cation transporter [Chloroherpetonaceae bacterium]MDW8437997.1 cation transporter [Chloroherpetonaceae bacterium]
MRESVFFVAKMDCMSEASLAEMKLKESPFVARLEADVPNRLLRVYHEGDSGRILSALNELGLQASLRSETIVEDEPLAREERERDALKLALVINVAFFLLECVAGIWAESMGLVADGLDMLADAMVYGLALYAVGGAMERKKRVALVAGIVQSVLAIVGFWEVVRRFLGVESQPDVATMLVVSALALVANATCAWLLQRSKSKEAHVQASLIFTSYDALANVGVMLAAALVYLFRSNLPDLVIGALIFALVVEGAIRIFKLAR